MLCLCGKCNKSGWCSSKCFLQDPQTCSVGPRFIELAKKKKKKKKSQWSPSPSRSTSTSSLSDTRSDSPSPTLPRRSKTLINPTTTVPTYKLILYQLAMVGEDDERQQQQYQAIQKVRKISDLKVETLTDDVRWIRLKWMLRSVRLEVFDFPPTKSSEANQEWEFPVKYDNGTYEKGEYLVLMNVEDSSINQMTARIKIEFLEEFDVYIIEDNRHVKSVTRKSIDATTGALNPTWRAFVTVVLYLGDAMQYLEMDYARRERVKQGGRYFEISL